MHTLIKSIFPLAVFIFSVAHNTEGQILNHLLYDTTNTAIIQYKKQGNWPVFNEYKASDLTQMDLIIIDSLYKIAIEEYNSKFGIGPIPGIKIDIAKNNYKRQIIAAINSNGEKEVWINCFCNSFYSNWKEEIVEMDDGGSCYFNFKINITRRKYYDFLVNGLAYLKMHNRNQFRMA